jgi:hypothetical protein
MNDSSTISPLIQRLAIGRSVAPGCVSCDQLQRTHDRFSSPPGARVSGRLFRRMEFAEPSAVGLLLARADVSLEPGEMSVAKADVATRAASVESGSHRATHAQAALGSTGSFVGSRLSRQSAGVTQPGAFVARKVATTSGAMASARIVQRLVERGGDISRRDLSYVAPVDVSAATARSMSEQTSRTDTSGSSAPRAADSITPAASNQHAVMRMAEQAAMTSRMGDAGVRSAGSSDVVSQAPASILTDVRVPVIAQRPLVTTLQRRAEETIARSVESRPQSTAAVGALIPASSWLNASASNASASNATIGVNAISTSVPLVLRKADAAVGPPAAGKRSPTISASAPRVIAREVAATAQPVPDGNAYVENACAPAMQWASAPQIALIVEQVESRLARRFEIERERQGVRSWRREN